MRTAYRWRWAVALMLTLFVLVCSGTNLTYAMTLEDLDAARRIDWSMAGYPGGIPEISEPVINAMDLGLAADGTTDDHAKIQAAIDGAPDPAVIYFPAGIYRLESPLELKTGVVLRGAGSDATRLEFFSDDGCMEINGASGGAYRSILGGLEKGSTQMTVSDASGFQVGQGGEIRQEDIDAVDPTGEWGQNPDWVPTHVVGQMVKIVAIDGNRLSIEPPLHIALTAQKSPEIMPVTFIRRIGVEDLTIKRLDTGTISNNISISRATDCWFRRIESDQTQKYHISVSKSLHLEIRTCYIHDAFHKGGGGRGYGTSLGRYVTSVLVEDTIFSDLRHAMIIQLGTNGCVFGYNYAQRNYSDDGWDKTYISVHGHYPFMNLFEGNIVGRAGLADYWGASGPGNTLFRNRIIGTDKHQDFGPYRGISVDDYSHQQNIIGNELTGSETRITFDGHTDSAQGTSKDVIVHGNDVHGTTEWDPRFSDQTLPDSFYRSEKPACFGVLPWPAMGPDQEPGTGTIPAMERLNAQLYIPQPSDLDDDDSDSDDSGDSGNDSGDSGSDGGSSKSGCFISSLT